MSAADYQESLRRLLADEGGYTNHPKDPGGPTNFGITIYDYRKYVKPGATAADVKAMTVDEAKRIYRAKYWDLQRCDELPSGVDYAVFDYGVNSGVGRSGKVLRRVLKLPADTSVVTDAVIAAARVGHADLISDAINTERLNFLHSLKTWPVFGGGWGRRVAGVAATCRRMALGQATMPADVHVPAESVGKAVVPVNTAAQKGSAGAVVTTGAVIAHQAGLGTAGTVGLCLAFAAIAIGAWLYFKWHASAKQTAEVTP